MSELTFPFKNMSINNLIDFVKAYKIIDYIDHINESDPNKNFETYIGIYESSLPNFESEILQVINTTGQKTIDRYFEILSSDIGYLKDIVSRENIESIVNKFNSDSLKRFEEEIENETVKFFESEDRNRGHLEEYDGVNTGIFWITREYRTVKKINYNFYCAEQKLKYIESDYISRFHEFITTLTNKLLDIAVKYGREWYNGNIISKVTTHIKPVLFVEGQLDIDYLKKAAELLNEERLLTQLDIRQRGGFKNLDKLWIIFSSENWETIAQKKIFLYDCDTDKVDEDSLQNYKRVIPTIPDHPIKKGIENLFDESLIKRALDSEPHLVDITESNGTKRGIPFKVIEFAIDRQEKRHFCDWVCQNGTAEDFRHFNLIFEMLRQILEHDA